MAKKILIVEDHEAIAENLSDFLEMAGYEPCGIAKNYDDAVQKFVESEPDLVILDVNLEGDLTGIDVAGFIRDKSDLPLIYFSATVEQDLLEKARRTKPFAFLTKPNEFANLKAAIDSALEGHSPSGMFKILSLSKVASLIAPSFNIPKLIPKT